METMARAYAGIEFALSLVERMLRAGALCRQGQEYISTAEHKHYPFFATQWHPEKTPFEFGNHDIPHTLDAIRTSQHLVGAGEFGSGCPRWASFKACRRPSPLPIGCLGVPPSLAEPRGGSPLLLLVAGSLEARHCGAHYGKPATPKAATAGWLPEEQEVSRAAKMNSLACATVQGNNFIDIARRSSHKPESFEQVRDSALSQLL